MFSQTFHPNLPIFLHGYIRHIRDISQLCSTAPAELLELVQSEICYAPVTEIASGGATYISNGIIAHQTSSDSGKAEEPWDGRPAGKCSSGLCDGEADESSAHSSLSQVLT